MYRIGIIGSESSHAMAFAQLLNGFDQTCELHFPDCRVVAVAGKNPHENKKLFEECKLDFIADSPNDMLGKVDAVMITSRNGSDHFEQAKPFIKAGIPLYIDKPFTSVPQDAVALVKLAKAKGVPLVGGSSTKYAYDVIALKNQINNTKLEEIHGGCISAPLEMENEYGGFSFYSPHVIEITLCVFGWNPQSVFAVKNGNNVTAIVNYNNYTITNHFNDQCYSYSGTIFSKSGTIFRELDLLVCYQQECENFVHMLRTGNQDFSYEQLVLPVFYSKAIETSFLTGTCQPIPQVIL